MAKLQRGSIPHARHFVRRRPSLISANRGDTVGNPAPEPLKQPAHIRSLAYQATTVIGLNTHNV